MGRSLSTTMKDIDLRSNIPSLDRISPELSEMLKILIFPIQEALYIMGLNTLT